MLNANAKTCSSAKPHVCLINPPPPKKKKRKMVSCLWYVHSDGSLDYLLKEPSHCYYLSCFYKYDKGILG